MIFNHLGLDPIELHTVTIEGKRYYVTPSGGHYPSVTTVIGSNAKKQAGLAKWRARVGAEKAQAKSTRAAGRGTRYHKLVEDYINNELDETKYKDQPLPWLMFNSSKHILNNINKVYLQEAALYSDYLKLSLGFCRFTIATIVTTQILSYSFSLTHLPCDHLIDGHIS